MSRQLLIVIKCNNNKDIVRGIYNKYNSNEIQISKFSAFQIADLEDEVKKVLNRIKDYKTIKFAWNVSNKSGEVVNDKYIINNRCYSNSEIEKSTIREYCLMVNKF